MAPPIAGCHLLNQCLAGIQLSSTLRPNCLDAAQCVSVRSQNKVWLSMLSVNCYISVMFLLEDKSASVCFLFHLIGGWETSQVYLQIQGQLNFYCNLKHSSGLSAKDFKKKLQVKKLSVCLTARNFSNLLLISYLLSFYWKWKVASFNGLQSSDYF